MVPVGGESAITAKFYNLGFSLSSHLCFSHYREQYDTVSL